MRSWRKFNIHIKRPNFTTKFTKYIANIFALDKSLLINRKEDLLHRAGLHEIMGTLDIGGWIITNRGTGLSDSV